MITTSCAGDNVEVTSISYETTAPPSSQATAPPTTITTSTTVTQTMSETSTQVSEPSTQKPDAQADIFDYSKDAQQLITEVEDTHPIFLIDGELPENYDAVRAEYLEYTSKPLTRTDFLLSTQRYLTILNDGHMGNGLIDKGLYIDISWEYENEGLFLLSDDGTLSDSAIIKIGGVLTHDVMKQIDRHYYAENEAARQHHYAVFSRQEEMLKLAGCEITDGKIVLTIDSAGASTTMECKLNNMNRYKLLYQNANAGYIIKHSKIDDIFYIDLRMFEPDKSVDKTADAIREEIAKGTTKFIIDVRGNPGGNSDVGYQLLQAMGMDVPLFGAYIRCSALAIKTHNLTQVEAELVYYEPDANTARRNEDVELVVLTDANTFSSATMLGVWVKDGKLGTIIGRPSINSPTSYGDMLPLRLSESDLLISISYKKFLRPDSTTDPKTLIPDVLVGRDEDAFDIAVEYLLSK